MSKLKICLMGERAHRTPLSYPVYRRLFETKMDYCRQPEAADYLVFSCLMDIRTEQDEIHRIFARRPDMRLMILSEEPLWDSVWGGDFFSKKGRIRLGDREYGYTYLNHWTTRIHDFEWIPYFITTDNDFFARYAFMFARNRRFSKNEIRSLWRKAGSRLAFYAECKTGAEWDVAVPARDVRGLSRYRTLLAYRAGENGVVRVGKGWNNEVARQLLPDWHLDKIAFLDQNAFMVSGIENTHQWNYISEKIFDAFAVCALPLYYAGPLHSVKRMVAPGAFINLYGLTVTQAMDKIQGFQVTDTVLEAYRAAQDQLARLFSEPDYLLCERERVVAEVMAEFA